MQGDYQAAYYQAGMASCVEEAVGCSWYGGQKAGAEIDARAMKIEAGNWQGRPSRRVWRPVFAHIIVAGIAENKVMASRRVAGGDNYQ